MFGDLKETGDIVWRLYWRKLESLCRLL